VANISHDPPVFVTAELDTRAEPKSATVGVLPETTPEPESASVNAGIDDMCTED